VFVIQEMVTEILLTVAVVACVLLVAFILSTTLGGRRSRRHG
jgi:hypothetical protein